MQSWAWKQGEMNHVLDGGFHRFNSLYWLGLQFETYELFIPGIFKCFSTTVNHG